MRIYLSTRYIALGCWPAGNGKGLLTRGLRRICVSFARHDYFWSYMVMKQVGIAELKAKLSEFLRVVQGGESIAVLDRNRAVAHIIPILERPALRIRKPVSNSPKPNKIPLPKPTHQKVDALDLLHEERQSHR